MKKRRKISHKIKKKGMSLMISYVLLISFAIIISTIIYRQIEIYAKIKNPINCPDGVSFFIYDVNCDMESSNLTFKIKNNGRFDIAGYFIHATNKSNQELATIDLSPNLISGGSNLTKSILFSQIGENVLNPNNERTGVFKLDNKIYSIEIVPVRYQKINNRMRFVQCGDARIRESVSCVTFDPLNMSGLVSWWKFEGNANDETNNNNDGTGSGGVSFKSGISGASAYFDGSSYITVPDSSSLDITGDISIAVWVNLISGGPNSVDNILYKGEGTGYMLEATDNNRCGGDYFNLQYGNSGNTGLCSITKVKRDNWQYLVVTYNQSNVLFYINGVLNSSAQQVASTTTNSINLQIGWASASTHFRGQLDELMIFNRVINSTEITQLYDYFG